MADISDVTGALASGIASLIYPNGSSQPSAIGVPCRIEEGFPLPATLEALAAKAGRTPTAAPSLISIFPVPNSTTDGGTPLSFDHFVISKPTPGIAVTVIDDIATFSGTAIGGEVCTIVVDGASAYSYVAVASDTPDTIAAALAVQALPGFPDTTTMPGGILTVAPSLSFIARIGVTATVGRKTHREKQQIRITVWSSNTPDRTTVAKAVDAYVKDTLRFAMPDTTAAILTYRGTDIIDTRERSGLYRRDLVYSALFDTVEITQATEVTFFGFNLSAQQPGP